MISTARSHEFHATLPPASRGKGFRLDDVRFSDSMTVEHNVLAPGVIGHIARHREIDVTSYEPSATDTWFHYDQVGSVMCTSGSNGQLASVYHPDAFGNMMASWQTGLWTDSYTTRAGWHHNTKEFDGDTGLVYMHQRWYLPEMGTFGSKAPYRPNVEHAYGFGEMNAVSTIDPDGRLGYAVDPDYIPPQVGEPGYGVKPPPDPYDPDGDNIPDRVDPDPNNPNIPVPVGPRPRMVIPTTREVAISCGVIGGALRSATHPACKCAGLLLLLTGGVLGVIDGYNGPYDDAD